ncbi:MAG: hypothetical protein ACRCYU_06470 [Nocardioides sp.]
MSEPADSPGEPPMTASQLPPGDGVAPWGKPLRAKRKRSYDPSPGARESGRDRRWFLRIVAWVVTALGATLLLFAVLPRQNPPPSVEGDVISSLQMMGLASIPIIAFGLFLVWWGYSKAGEPMVACARCLHINKPRSVECAKCGEQLG